MYPNSSMSGSVWLDHTFLHFEKKNRQLHQLLEFLVNCNSNYYQFISIETLRKNAELQYVGYEKTGMCQFEKVAQESCTVTWHRKFSHNIQIVHFIVLLNNILRFTFKIFFTFFSKFKLHV